VSELESEQLDAAGARSRLTSAGERGVPSGSLSRRDVVVGVDIGTTETKALVIDCEDGTRVGFARRPTTWTTHPDGRVETDGDAFVADVLGAVTAALDALPVRVRGIGLAGLGESGVLLDPAGHVVTPVISWFDRRGAVELAGQDGDFLAALPGRVGLRVDSQCTLAKLLWLRGTGLSIAPGSQWLNIPEFVAHALGADRVTEPSLASRTGMIDQSTGQPWPEAIGRVGVEPSFLPPVLAAGFSAGRVTHPDAPEVLRGAEITVVGHDHPVAAVGAGAVEPNVLFNSTGTADVLLRTVPGRLPVAERARLVDAGYSAGAHVLPGHTALLGSVWAGLVLGRVLDLLGRNDSVGKAELDRRWRPANATANVVVSGARQADTEVVIRVTDGVGPDAVWAAALAHVTAETGALLAAADRIVGPHREAVAAGGWVRLASVRAAKGTVLPGLRFADVDQPGAFGAALFAAWAAAGNPGSFTEFSERLRPARTAAHEEATT
jgi:sugar (pentulose or hexulose) kinase